MTDLFNEKAKDWDANDFRRQLSNAIGAAILKHVPLHAKMEVMDFGAGTGLISSHVAPSVQKILALDISESMLSQLLSKPELQGKVDVLCQNIVDKPIDGKFDLIMSAMAMHHVEDADKLIQRFSEHLKAGAMVALADLDKEDGGFHPANTEGVFHFGFERKEFQALLEKHGFKDICFHTAHTVVKEGNEFPIFLVIASKK
ncbi:class I SAM-dependent methyltransferase [Psychromonas sp. MB-3u-54]|uniref:class I SAM-dependent DNA methyltransferase n=1 Tax=Psychromonas sp. MB-3u-54 TaxID=2058319 RepID=UPI000C336CD2|nr:class I SAM-dependent methyltransferase [Psychromonas sp. MB-3u-54]PKH02450.1 class I SAM-dependent methyltransferase [Psychromonas sp. MB-3u-54]